MNEKINLRQLTDRLPADIFGNDPEQRTQAVGEIFALIAETLESGESVAVKGLGIFSLTGVKESPVAFEPDRAFMAVANAPFDAFSPVILPDEVTDSDLAEVEKARPSESEESAESVELAESQVSDDGRNEEAEPAVEPENAPEPEPESEPEPEPVVEPEPEPEISEAPAPAPDSAPETEPDPEPYAEPASQPEPVYEPASEHAPEAETEPEAASSRFGTGFFWGLLTGLLVGAILFMIYVLITTRTEPMPAYEIEAEAADAAITAIE